MPQERVVINKELGAKLVMFASIFVDFKQSTSLIDIDEQGFGC